MGFDVLTSNGDSLTGGNNGTYDEAATVIDKYSAEPRLDKEQLLLRAILSARINHTSNGLDNLRMLDHGSNHWRLAPAFNTLPNPMFETPFRTTFGGHQVSRKHFVVDKTFATNLAKSFNLPGESGLHALDRIETSIESRKALFEEADFNVHEQLIVARALAGGSSIVNHELDSNNTASPGM